jgi:hypothetical protein
MMTRDVFVIGFIGLDAPRLKTALSFFEHSLKKVECHVKEVKFNTLPPYAVLRRRGFYRMLIVDRPL